VIFHGVHGYMIQFLGVTERNAVHKEYEGVLARLCSLKKVRCLHSRKVLGGLSSPHPGERKGDDESYEETSRNNQLSQTTLTRDWNSWRCVGSTFLLFALNAIQELP
jgi:hypothetical protein